MTLRYLLDTNVLAEPLRPRPNAKVLRLLQAHEETVCTASTVWHEMWFGAMRLDDSKRKQTIQAYLSDLVVRLLPILPYDEPAAEFHAKERARLEKAGTPAPFADGQIAAVASVNELTLVTANPSDFSSFAGLRVENWFK